MKNKNGCLPEELKKKKYISDVLGIFSKHIWILNKGNWYLKDVKPLCNLNDKNENWSINSYNFVSIKLISLSLKIK